MTLQPNSLKRLEYQFRLQQAKELTRQRAPTAWHADVQLLTPHEKQSAFIDNPAKRKVVKAGRRGGKTTGMAILAVRAFMAGRRVLYAAPTQEQIDAFWGHVKRALQKPIDSGALTKNETLHFIEIPGTRTRIRAKTAWNADTLRGDHADLLILDEWQLMDETAWTEVGAPMLLDNDGDAVFIFTPPSLRTRSASKARNKRHALELFKKVQADDSGRWAAFHFRSHDNPYISKEALAEIAKDMTSAAYRQEIEAEDTDDAPGALWKRDNIETHRRLKAPELTRIVVGVDPAATSNSDSDETGIVVCGIGKDGHGYVLDDKSLQASPDGWARATVVAYHAHEADRVIAEANNGGEMVDHTLRTVDANVPVKLVRASRGKATRAEPIAALYEQGKIHHVGAFPELEDQLCQWTPGDSDSPDRLDALVWALTELLVTPSRIFDAISF